jgi:hypothetical protein
MRKKKSNQILVCLHKKIPFQRLEQDFCLHGMDAALWNEEMQSIEQTTWAEEQCPHFKLPQN